MDTLGTDATVHKTEESKSTVPRVVEKYEYSLDGFHLGVARAPNVNFRKISDRKMIWDLEFSEHLL